MTKWPPGWKSLTLGEAARWYSGGTPSTSRPEYWGGDIPWITSGSLTEFRLKMSERTLTELGVASGSRLVPAGTTLFVVRGMSLKTEFRIGIAMHAVAFGQDCKALSPVEGLENEFLTYSILAQTPRVLALVDEAGHGTGRLNTDQMKALTIGVPSTAEQRSIVSILNALNDKIEANQRLVSVSDALWRSIAGHVINLIEEGERTDGGLQPLSSLARFINGRAFTKNATGQGRMVIRIAELNSGPGASTIYNDISVAPEYLAGPGDLLFAWSGSLTLQRWYRPEAIVNQHIFKVVPEIGIPIWLVHAHLVRLLPGYQRIAAGKATTMGHIQRRDLDVSVGVPGRATIERLNLLCDSLWHRSLKAEIENLALIALRDTLLPQLLGGELRVRDAAAIVEEAV